jgi:protein O-GlcNAc transferase
LQLQCARTYVKHKTQDLPTAIEKPKAWRHDKIRIAYVSADFHEHATSHLIAELFERHDRKRFELFGISLGPDDGSEIRRRVVEALDHFHDVRAHDDREVASLLRELEIDIAVDLKGHTKGERFGIFAHRPAPIQVSYLGFPGTTGADFIDYVIADEIVLPFDQQPFWSEKIVHLPGCYQVNDRKREIAERTPTRKECGLPEQGFVFCSFNNSYKITPEFFDIWMRLLNKIEGSALWLLRGNAAVERNLRREAAARGVDPARLVFAEPIVLCEHLARHRLADLFLDTLPVNAHTTASDALWAGLPVLTCLGKGFAARVAASLLDAVGLPELVTKSLEEYEALALKLAREPALLSAYRDRLEKNGPTAQLFDADRLRRHLEQAYTTMLDIERRGEKPRGFSVDPT